MQVSTTLAHKYSGGGHGGYVLYLFEFNRDHDDFVEQHKEAIKIEPYLNLIA